MDQIRQQLEQALAGVYVIERELGGGGMSRTYLAREEALQRRVVIKVLAPELLAGISVERFRREGLQESGLVKEAIAGWERDQASLSSDPVGRRAEFAANLAWAEGRWADVISSITVAEQRFAMSPRGANVMRGMAYRALGQADSAIASFQRFLTLRDPFPDWDSNFRSDALIGLGEMYEAKGDRNKAIDYYGRFTELWKDADPKLQPRVRDVRDRIARLQAQAG